MKRFIYNIISGYCIYIVITVILMSVSAFAVEPPPTPVKRINVTISEKGAGDFFAKERRYIVTSSTVILNYHNERISYDSLWVPCKADVYYRTVNTNESECVKIKVRSSLKKDSKNPETKY